MAKQRKPRKQYPDTEAGRVEKSKDLASRRVSHVLSAIGSVTKLASNKRAYVYTADQVTTICAAIERAYDEMRDAFNAKGPTTKQAFKL